MSPFGAAESCGGVPGTPARVVFVDSEVEPWVDVNPTDPDNIVVFWQQDRWSNGGARGNVAGVSFDAGASWQLVVVPGLTDCSGGDFERASDPWISFGPDGTLHQVGLDFDIDPPTNRPGGFGRSALAASKSTDGGVTWSAPILLVEDDNPRILHDEESITADPQNADLVYVVCDRLEVALDDVINPENVNGLGFRSPFYFARSTDGGDTWTSPVKINLTPGNANPLRRQAFLPSVAVAANTGTVAVTYYDFRNDDGTGELAHHWMIHCHASCSDPASWEDEIRLTDASFDYSRAPLARARSR